MEVEALGWVGRVREGDSWVGKAVEGLGGRERGNYRGSGGWCSQGMDDGRSVERVDLIFGEDTRMVWGGVGRLGSFGGRLVEGVERPERWQTILGRVIKV